MLGDKHSTLGSLVQQLDENFLKISVIRFEFLRVLGKLKDLINLIDKTGNFLIFFTLFLNDLSQRYEAGHG